MHRAESPSAIIQIFKSKYHLKVKGDGKLTYYLGADYFEDPDGTFVSQPKKYIDKLADTYRKLINISLLLENQSRSLRAMAAVEKEGEADWFRQPRWQLCLWVSSCCSMP